MATFGVTVLAALKIQLSVFIRLVNKLLAYNLAHSESCSSTVWPKQSDWRLTSKRQFSN